MKSTAIYFVFLTYLIKSLAEGDSVKFDTEAGPKGPKAINVIKL